VTARVLRRSGMVRLLLAGGLLGLVAAVSAAGPMNAEPAKTAPSRNAGKHGGPTWAQLNADQREALAPLASDWDKFDDTRKRKWLDIAVRYKDLSPEGQQRMHERMPDLAKLTPEQRSRARENFKQAYALPPEQRRALTQQFQDLPEERKRELAEQSKKKPGPPPRRSGARNPPSKSGAAATHTPAARSNPADAAAGSASAGGGDAASEH